MTLTPPSPFSDSPYSPGEAIYNSSDTDKNAVLVGVTIGGGCGGLLLGAIILSVGFESNDSSSKIAGIGLMMFGSVMIGLLGTCIVSSWLNRKVVLNPQSTPVDPALLASKLQIVSKEDKTYELLKV